MMTNTTIIIFYNDLRITDNQALLAALDEDTPIIPLYIYSCEKDKHPLGCASKWWLHQSLYQFDLQLKKLGSRLIIKKGNILEVLKELISNIDVKNVYWSRGAEPHTIVRDQELIKYLNAHNIQTKIFNSHLLFDSWDLKTQQGKPFQVFTPFWKALQQSKKIRPPLKAPEQLPKVPSSIIGDSLESLNLESSMDCTRGLKSMWQPGEEAGLIRFSHFIENQLEFYEKTRDRPDLEGTSHLSAHLHFGEISPRYVWNEVEKWIAKQDDSEAISSAEVFLKELAWREFAHHILYHFPNTVDSPMNPAFSKFPWIYNDTLFETWSSGKTGYPIVDAGMRELYVTGWMHNRVRMIVASFLVKDLLIPWQKGAQFFWEKLVDADLANNTLNWQWSAGSGADAAPYFRIFNPVIQGEKFDPEGLYIRKWIPEIAKLNNDVIHKPWTATEIELKLADITLGETYPEPIVDHAKARIHALKAFEKVKQ